MQLWKWELTKMARSKFMRAAIFFLCLPLLFLSSGAMAGPTIANTAWFVNFVKMNNGRAFCLPPTMTFPQAAQALAEYGLAHPQFQGRITDPQAIQAFEEMYPCAVSQRVPGNPAVSPGYGQRPVEIQVHPQGEYATIDTRLDIETIRRLEGTAGHENDALISQIENNSGNYEPPVLFALATRLYKQGKSDDAIFWFHAGFLRGHFDAARCADVSARSGITELEMHVPVQLRLAQLNDLEKLKDIIRRVVKWDETTPYHYDYRWINLHGLNAIASGLGNAKLANRPLTLPRDQWAALAQKTREEYVASFDTLIAAREKQKALQ